MVEVGLLMGQKSKQGMVQVMGRLKEWRSEILKGQPGACQVLHCAKKLWMTLQRPHAKEQPMEQPYR